MKKKIIIIPAALMIVAVGAYFLWHGSRTQHDGRIFLSGNIELTQVNIAFTTAGRIEQIGVGEGDSVSKGQELARLDRDQLVQQQAAAQAALAAAQAQLAQAGTALEWQRRTVSGDVEARSAELKSALARLEELKTGSRPQEIREAEAAVAAARTEQERAARDWERAQQLFKDDDISAQQHDQFRARFEGTAAALRQSEQRLALVREGPRRETIEVAAAQVERARAAMQMGRANELEIRRREQEIPARQAEIARLQAQLGLIREQLDDTVATSPIDGVVLVKSADPGEITAPGTTILTLGDIERPWLRGYIPEPDLGRVKLGQKAKVTTDSFPGKAYWGKITFISPEAEFTPKQIQTQQERVKLVYRIKIEVDNPQRELKLNMPADAEIVVE
jgi:HlyD family secretion protein